MKVHVNSGIVAKINTQNYDEIKNLIVGPKIGISYQTSYGSHSGTFDNVPENAFGANILQYFPIVNSDGNMTIAGMSFDFYVGQKAEKDGIEGAIVNGQFIKTEPDDKVFASLEEMKQAITNIKTSFGIITNDCILDTEQKQTAFTM